MKSKQKQNSYRKIKYLIESSKPYKVLYLVLYSSLVDPKTPVATPLERKPLP